MPIAISAENCQISDKRLQKYNNINSKVQEMSKSKKNRTIQNIPLFIQKLSNILEDETCQEYIHWVSMGDAFNIQDINRFTDIVLPKYFKHSNFSSFIRQLNMYGFSKIRHDEGENVYTNQNFKRDEKQLLVNIKRKINHVEKDDKIAVYSPAQGSANLGKQLTDLKTRQRNLENMCRQLIDQNNRILEENNMMMKRLTTEQKEKNNKMEQLLVSLIMARGSNQLALPSSEQPRMLSLANEVKPDYGSNFDDFCQFLEEGNGNNRLQEALKKFQSQQKKRNKNNKNYTIVNQIQPENPSPSPIPHQKNQKQQPKSQEKKEIKIQDHDNSMLSLGDFLNLDSVASGSNIEPPI